MELEGIYPFSQIYEVSLVIQQALNKSKEDTSNNLNQTLTIKE